MIPLIQVEEVFGLAEMSEAVIDDYTAVRIPEETFRENLESSLCISFIVIKDELTNGKITPSL